MVVANDIIDRSTSLPMTVAVIAFVQDPRCQDASGLTGLVDPARSTPAVEVL